MLVSSYQFPWKYLVLSGLIVLSCPMGVMAQIQADKTANTVVKQLNDTKRSRPGGQIRLASPQIQVRETTITSQSFGNAQAGDIVIDGNVLVLSDRASLSTSSAQQSV